MTLAVSGLLLSPIGVLGLAGPASAAPGPNLGVTIDAPDLLAYNDTARVTFTVTNTGDSPSTATDLAVSLFQGGSGVNASGCTAANQTSSSCPIPVLAPGAHVSFEFRSRPPSSDWGGSGTVTGTLPGGDADPSDDGASRTVAFAGPTTFTETLTGPGPTVTAGSTITLRVRITNTGQNPGITNFEMGFDETMEPRNAVEPSGFSCGADPYVWLCTTGVIGAGADAVVEFPFVVPRSDVGRRLVAGVDGDTSDRWSALVVAPPSPPSAPKPPASPGSAADPAAPTLANTGPPLGREAAVALFLCLTGLGLNAGARQLSPARRWG